MFINLLDHKNICLDTNFAFLYALVPKIKPFKNFKKFEWRPFWKVHKKYISHGRIAWGFFSVVSGAKWTTKTLQSVCLQFCPGRSVNWLDYRATTRIQYMPTNRARRIWWKLGAHRLATTHGMKASCNLSNIHTSAIYVAWYFRNPNCSEYNNSYLIRNAYSLLYISLSKILENNGSKDIGV